MALDDVLVVNTGRELTVDALIALAATAPIYLQWGVSSQAVAAADVDLIDKTGCNETPRATGVDSKVSNYTYRVVGTLTKTVAAAIIRELGTFNDAGSDLGPPVDGDTMFLRAMFDAISLNVGNAIEFTVDTLVTAT